MHRKRWLGKVENQFQRSDAAADHRRDLLARALDLAPQGKLRAFVPFEPRWCRTVPEKVVTLLLMGHHVTAVDEGHIDAIYRAASQLQESGRYAIDPLKDGAP